MPRFSHLRCESRGPFIYVCTYIWINELLEVSTNQGGAVRLLCGVVFMITNVLVVHGFSRCVCLCVCGPAVSWSALSSHVPELVTVSVIGYDFRAGDSQRDRPHAQRRWQSAREVTSLMQETVSVVGHIFKAGNHYHSSLHISKHRRWAAC